MTRLGKSMWLDVARRSSFVYALGLLLLTAPNLTIVIDRASARSRHGMTAIGLGICFAFWVYRYVRGFESASSRKRHRMHSATSGVLVATPLVISLVIYDPGPSDVLGSANRLVAWTAVACLVSFSVVVRGHERKLHGVYRGQTRWLTENPQAMAEVLPKHPSA